MSQTTAAAEEATVSIRPQPGPQERFLSSSADIVIYGGAAGGGKSWGLLMEPLRHVTTNHKFAAVFFRRNTTQIRNPGGLWDESRSLYPLLGAKPISQVLEWRWPFGGRIKFAHLEHESTVYDWQGAQIPLICFDELTHFTKMQFFYMLSRNRSTSGVKPYIRATTNPDADSWVREFIAWWIDPDTGYAIAERSGIVRWFIRVNDTIVWGGSSEDLVTQYGNPDLPANHTDQVQPKSATFIAAKLDDNKILLKKDPSYKGNLMAQNAVERARLLGGNWKIRPAAGLYFRREWVKVIDAEPAGLEVVRYWDLAATEKTADNDPDWTVGIKLGFDRRSKRCVVLHAVRMRAGPHKVEQAILNTAAADGRGAHIALPQDPGQAGKSQAQSLVAMLSGYQATARSERGDKVVRFSPFSAQCEAGNVDFLRGSWNSDVFDALEAFPEASHDDDADACSGAYAHFVQPLDGQGLIDFMRQQAEAKTAARAGA
jgi:predicted phage terminase large subunit-like protein